MEIHPPVQPNRVRRNEPPNIRIVKPERVVVQPGVAVQVLALEAQVLRQCAGLGLGVLVVGFVVVARDGQAGPLLGEGVAPGFVGGSPANAGRCGR